MPEREWKGCWAERYNLFRFIFKTVATIEKNGVTNEMKRYLQAFTLFVLLAATTAYAERLAVAVPEANVRAGAGESYEVMWKIDKYFPVEVLETKGEWCRFRDYENDEGWIHKSLLKKISSVITKKDRCNIRSGPGTDYRKVFTVDNGIPFRVIKNRGKWLKIRHSDGDEGWIHKSLVW